MNKEVIIPKIIYTKEDLSDNKTFYHFIQAIKRKLTDSDEYIKWEESINQQYEDEVTSIIFTPISLFDIIELFVSRSICNHKTVNVYMIISEIIEYLNNDKLPYIVGNKSDFYLYMKINEPLTNYKKYNDVFSSLFLEFEDFISPSLLDYIEEKIKYIQK